MRRTDRELTAITEIEEIIGRSDVCRIAFAYENTPYMVTMNFGYINEPEQMLFFHCANEGRKLDMIRRNSYVCFEMDTDHELFPGKRGCDWGMKFSSVVGYGKIDIITDQYGKIEGLKSIMEHYGGKKEYFFDEKVLAQTTILRLNITEMTAKKKK